MKHMKILCIKDMGIKYDETACYPGWGTTGHIGVHLPQLEGQTRHLGAGHRLLILCQYLHCKLYKIKKLLPLTMYYIHAINILARSYLSSDQYIYFFSPLDAWKDCLLTKKITVTKLFSTGHLQVKSDPFYYVAKVTHIYSMNISLSLNQIPFHVKGSNHGVEML